MKGLNSPMSRSSVFPATRTRSFFPDCFSISRTTSSCDAGSGQMPPTSECRRCRGQFRDYGTDIRDEDELVRTIDGPDQVRDAAGCSGRERAVQEALVDARAIEIRQPQYRCADLACRVRGHQQIFLLFAHTAFEGVRLTRMVFPHGGGTGTAVWIHGADQHEALHPGRDGAVQRLFHQRWVKRELPVVHAHEVNERVDAFGGR